MMVIVIVHLHFDCSLSQRARAENPDGGVVLALKKFWVWERCEDFGGPNSQSVLDVSGNALDD